MGRQVILDSLKKLYEFLRIKSYQADLDIRIREATNTDGKDHWEYVLLYVDECLVVSDQGEKMIREEIANYFNLK